MEYNNEKLTKLVEDKSVEKIVFNTWKECRIIRKDKSVKYMSGIFASEDEYKEFAQRLIKQVKKKLKISQAVYSLRDEERNVKITILHPLMSMGFTYEILFTSDNGVKKIEHETV